MVLRMVKVMFALGIGLGIMLDNTASHCAQVDLMNLIVIIMKVWVRKHERYAEPRTQSEGTLQNPDHGLRLCCESQPVFVFFL